MGRVKNTDHAVCINTGGYLVSLELNAVYETLPDDDAAEDGLIRVIDESGEDYLYPESCFVSAEVDWVSRLAQAPDRQTGDTFSGEVGRNLQKLSPAQLFPSGSVQPMRASLPCVRCHALRRSAG